MSSCVVKSRESYMASRQQSPAYRNCSVVSVSCCSVVGVGVDVVVTVVVTIYPLY